MLIRIVVLFLLISCLNSTSAANLTAVCSSSLSEDECPPEKLSFPVFDLADSGKAEVSFVLDTGSFGDFSSSEMTTLLNEVHAKLQAQSNLAFISGDTSLGDVDETNFQAILSRSEALGFNPYVLDDKGEILEALLGKKAKKSILGFASPEFYDFDDDGNVRAIGEYTLLLNGFFYTLANRPDLSIKSQLSDDLESTLIHEIMHTVGIGHTQGGQLKKSLKQKTNSPIMFPFSNRNTTLHRDDIAALNLAYPLEGFSASTGSISGVITKRSNVRHSVNVVAHRVDDPFREYVAVANDSDGLHQGNYKITGLSPGDYIVRFEAVCKRCRGGSAVGFHSPVAAKKIGAGFYRGPGKKVLPGKAVNRSISRSFVITVDAGEEIEGIDIDTKVSSPDPSKTVEVI